MSGNPAFARDYATAATMADVAYLAKNIHAGDSAIQIRAAIFNRITVTVH